MVSNPKAGWCSFEIGEFQGHPSYLTNVPMDLLEGFIEYEKNKNKKIEICFDEEGTEFSLFTENNQAYIIAERRTTFRYDIDKTIRELENEVLSDIKSDLDNWAMEFIVFEKDYPQNKQNLIDKIDELEKLLK